MARCETSWRVVFVFFRFAREAMRRTNTHGVPLRTRSSHRKDDGWSQISSRRSIWLAATRQNGPLGLHSRWAVRETWGFPIAGASEASQTQVSGVRIDRPDVFCDHPCEYARQVAPKSTDRAGGAAEARPPPIRLFSVRMHGWHRITNVLERGSLCPTTITRLATDPQRLRMTI